MLHKKKKGVSFTVGYKRKKKIGKLSNLGKKILRAGGPAGVGLLLKDIKSMMKKCKALTFDGFSDQWIAETERAYLLTNLWNGDILN